MTGPKPYGLYLSIFLRLTSPCFLNNLPSKLNNLHFPSVFTTDIVTFENEAALLDSDPVGNRIQIENGEVIFRASVVEISCSAK